VSVKIHPTAVVSERAELGEGVSVGPYSIIEEDVTIGPGTVIDAHVMVKAHTSIGRDCRLYPYASLGTDPQDLLYQGEETRLVIGDNNIIREFATLNRGTPRGGVVTRLGSHNMLMAYTHVGHDCQLGDHVVMVNLATLAGHCHVEDWAVLSGLVAVQQFTRIGTHAFIGGMTGVDKDVPPYCVASDYRARLYGLNTVGLKRRGFPAETVAQLKEAYRLLFRNKDSVLSVNLDRVEESLGHVPEVKRVVDFIRASKRGICR